jgi:4-amino-4-deoxy-L-arabinose transferase-like glycosyltransferase
MLKLKIKFQVSANKIGIILTQLAFAPKGTFAIADVLKISDMENTEQPPPDQLEETPGEPKLQGEPISQSKAVEISRRAMIRLPRRLAWLLLWPLLVGVAYAFYLPSYSAPDEAAHAAYVSALAQGHLPVLPTQRRVDVAAGVTYEAFHPPIYYLTATPLYWATRGEEVRGLRSLRLFNVALFLIVVVLVYALARALLPDERSAFGAAFLIATHPVLVYMASVATNEILALALSICCVLSAHAARRDPGRWRWITICILFGGLSLLTRFTAIAGVVAAACLVAINKGTGKTNARRSPWSGALAVLVGSLLPWVIWSAILHATHGRLIAPELIPTFSGGPIAILLYPLDAFNVGSFTLAQLGNGLVLPAWLMYNRYTAYILVAHGFLVTLWLLWLNWKSQALRFVVPAYLTLAALLVSYTFFVDLDDANTASRFASPVIIYFALPAAAEYGRASSRMRIVFAALWLLAATIATCHVFMFFR